MTKLAKEFKLSDNGLRKICKKYDIPTPIAGHWSKLEHGKKVSKAPLPKSKHTNIEFHPIELSEREIKLARAKEVEQDLLANPSLIFKVPSKLSQPHSLVLKTKEYIENRVKRKEDYTTFNTQGGMLKVDVSLAHYRRALRIFDTVLKNLEILGYTFSFGYNGFKVVSEYADMELYVLEKSTAHKRVSSYDWEFRDLKRNGNLSIKFGSYGYSEVTDSKQTKLEDKILFLLTKIVAEFRKRKEQALTQRAYQAEADRKRKIEEEIQARKDAELDKFKDFHTKAHRWREYEILNEYYQHLKKSESHSQEYLNWVKNKLDWFNPEIEANDDLLKDIDRNTLKDSNK
jgi:hypothetical protein